MEFFKTNIIWASAILFSLAIVSCGGNDETSLTDDARPTVQAKLAMPGGTASEGYMTISGKIQAKNFANISSRTMGYVTKVNVEVGDRVRAGQVLATINNADMQAKLAQAEAGISEAKAGLDNLEKDFARIQSLYQKKSATQKELDDITANRDMMKAKLRQAQEAKNEVSTMLSYSKVKAPFNGIVTEKQVHVGDLASPGSLLFAMESDEGFQAEAMVPESQITSISKGDKVSVVLKSSGQKINGTIGEYSSSSLNTGGQYLIKINLDKKEVKNIKLYSGMYVNVLVTNKNENNSEGKITVNKNAIVRQGQLTGLYTLSDNNTAILRWVRLGKTYGDQVEVLSGLSLEEPYITENDGRLLNGVKVEIGN